MLKYIVALSLTLGLAVAAVADEKPYKEGPVTDVAWIRVKDGKLMVKVDSVKGEYNGTLAGKTITGNWVQGPINTPLVLTR